MVDGLGGAVMAMQKAIKVFTLTAALTLVLLDSPSRAKEVYKWVDEKGGVHFAEDELNVPEKYRDQIEKKSLPEESKTPKEKVKTEKQDRKKAKGKVEKKEKGKIDVNGIESDVIDSFKTIISLWKDGKYQTLYDHGDHKSRMSVNREQFEHRMTKKGIGLASSWETVGDIEVEVKSATLAYVTAKVGFKPTRGGETKFRTETYRMSFEKGMWRIDLSKILSAKI
jgi:hypothetical protein